MHQYQFSNMIPIKQKMHQPSPEHQTKFHSSVPDNLTDANQPRRSTRSNLGQRFPTYSQEYDSIDTVSGEIMSMNTILPRRTEIYANALVSDTDTMYFFQAMKENDDT